jgi:2-(1,2-epoxy-1,2-dihydrophenyl)acetyl-CoA isomerase
MTDAVLLEVADGIATLTFNRPQALNALDRAMLDALAGCLDRLDGSRDVGCVVVTGAGAHFMAGGDIKMFHELRDLEGAARGHFMGGFVGEVHEQVLRLSAVPQPVLAKVRGAVAGFGVSLLGLCDLAVAADDMVLSLAYARLGVSPDGSSTYSLPRLVGLKKAKELALLSDRIDGRTALDLGLVNRLVPAADLDREAAALARRLAQGPALAQHLTKSLLNSSSTATLEQQLAVERDAFARCAESDDFLEGVEAFVAKRPPCFGGA